MKTGTVAHRAWLHLSQRPGVRLTTVQLAAAIDYDAHLMHIGVKFWVDRGVIQRELVGRRTEYWVA